MNKKDKDNLIKKAIKINCTFKAILSGDVCYKPSMLNVIKKNLYLLLVVSALKLNNIMLKLFYIE